MHQHREPNSALYQYSHSGAVEPDDQVYLPMAGHGPVFDFGGTLADHDILADVRLRFGLHSGARHAQRPSGTQVSHQLTPQSATAQAQTVVATPP